MKLVRCVFLGLCVFTGSGRLQAEQSVSAPPKSSLDRSTTAKLSLADEGTGFFISIDPMVIWNSFDMGASSPSTKPRKMMENAEEVLKKDIGKCEKLIEVSRAAVTKIKGSTTSDAPTQEAEKRNLQVILKQVFNVSQGKGGDGLQAEKASKHEKDKTAKHDEGSFADEGPGVVDQVPEPAGYFAKLMENIKDEKPGEIAEKKGEDLKKSGKKAESTAAEKGSKSTEADKGSKSTETDKSLKSTEAGSSIKNLEAEKDLGKRGKLTESLEKALEANAEACEKLIKLFKVGEKEVEGALKKTKGAKPSDAPTQEADETIWKSLKERLIQVSRGEGGDGKQAEATKEKQQ